MPERVRILSDLHYLDGDSRLRDLRQLEPLLGDVDHLVLNGDSLDTQRTSNGDGEAAILHAWFESRVKQVTFLTGNHDPVISDTHELDLCGGAVWLFHGDVLYDGIAPWSSIGRRLTREVRQARVRAGLGRDAKFDELIRIHRSVCRTIHVEYDVTRKDLPYRAWRFFRSLFPPNQLLTMLYVWSMMPRHALAFASRHRPAAKVVVTGHCHAPSIRHEGGRWAINTGSFCRPRGTWCVDVVANELEVREVISPGPDPLFRVGPQRLRIQLA
ncbi:MAG: metallophosphoesterase family protein [Opitutaceae bacterium]|nr:metallophosphoesterase family protein [Opitutaceae bacterium]